MKTRPIVHVELPSRMRRRPGRINILSLIFIIGMELYLCGDSCLEILGVKLLNLKIPDIGALAVFEDPTRNKLALGQGFHQE